jgi:hypothetical protein
VSLGGSVGVMIRLQDVWPENRGFDFRLGRDFYNCFTFPVHPAPCPMDAV